MDIVQNVNHCVNIPSSRTFRCNFAAQLTDPVWLLDLALLTDLTAKLNELNTEFQC
jgi:hypothetical protein